MEEKTDYYVYMYLREKDSRYGKSGSPYYAGKGRGGRVSGKHRVRVPQDTKYISIIAEKLTNDAAKAIEIGIISQYGRIDIGTGCLANLTNGGDGNSGWKCNESTKRKISEKAKGRKMPDSVYQKHAKRMVGSRNPFFGRRHGKETRKRWSEARKGVSKEPFTEEHKDNMSVSALGSYKTGRAPWNKGKKGAQDYSRLLKDSNGKFIPNGISNRVRRNKRGC